MMDRLNQDELAELLREIRDTDEDYKDELLTDLLISPYPTKITQDN